MPAPYIAGGLLVVPELVKRHSERTVFINKRYIRPVISTYNPLKNKKIRYVDCNSAGYRRLAKGKGFCYKDQENKTIRDAKIIARINALVIPPNWEQVWICPIATGHIQATGIDAKGRKQYIYHLSWVLSQDKDKFAFLADFGEKLPQLRKKINRDLNRKSYDLKKVTALALRVIDLTSMRPGNQAYLKQNGSYGLTTLEKKHLKIEKEAIQFNYIGKKAVPQEKLLKNRKLAKELKALKSLPGSPLFKYYDKNQELHGIDSAHLNLYLQSFYKKHLSCKTFRTWNACFNSLAFLLDQPMADSAKERQKTGRELVKTVAKSLGNTAAVAKKNYILPAILTQYEAGNLDSWLKANAKKTKTQRKRIIPQKLLKLIKEYR